MPAPIVRITGGRGGVAALLTDGSVYVWGANGQQGDGTPEGGTDPTPHRTTIDDVVELSADAGEFLARRADGTIYRWGPTLDDEWLPSPTPWL